MAINYEEYQNKEKYSMSTNTKQNKLNQNYKKIQIICMHLRFCSKKIQ